VSKSKVEFMKVFMSWSGTRSKAAAELLHDWVKCVVQASRPWISTRGIGRGAVWFSEINNELKDTTVGIICLTHQNKSSPWILFEAGALAKGLTTTKVCTFLVDLMPTDIQDPLAQFNHTLPNKEGMMSLAATLNSALENPLDGVTLTSVFEAFWPQFEKDFQLLLDENPQEVKVEVRTENSMLTEILESTRGLSQRIRAIEDRESTNPAFSTYQQHTGSDAGITPVNEGFTRYGRMRAVNELRRLAAKGFNMSQAFDAVAREYGPKLAEHIYRQLNSLNPPIEFNSTDKDN
jgi:hypothetical protein